MDSLRRQAARARKARELDAEIKATQRVLLAGKAVELEEAKQRILDDLDRVERRVAELTAQVSEKASEVEALRLSVDEQQQAQARRASAMLGLDQRLQLASQERSFQEDRKVEARDQRGRVEEHIQMLVARLAESGDSFSALEAQLKDAGERLARQEAELAKAEEAVGLAQGGLRHAEADLHALRDRKAESQKEALARQKQRIGLQTQVAQLEGRLDTLNHEESGRAPRLESLEAEASQVERTLEGLLAQLEQAEEAALDQRRRAEQLEEAQRTLAQDHHRAEAELDAAERRLRQLSDLLAKSFGEAELQKGLTWLREQGIRPQTLVDLLKVDEALRPDLERLLGSWLQVLAADEGLTGRAAEAPGHLLLALEAGSAPLPPAPKGCEALRDHLRWAGSDRPLGGLLDRAFRCDDAVLPALALAHPDLAFVSPAFVRLPFGPVQLGVSAPAASPLKLRAEQEEAKALKAVERYLPTLKGIRVFLSAGEFRAVVTGGLFQELGMEIVGLRSYHHDDFGTEFYARLVEAQKGKDFPVDIANFQPFELVNLLKRVKPDLFCGHVFDNAWAARLGFPTITIFRIFDYYVGYRGYYEVAKKAVRNLRNHAFNTRLSQNVQGAYKKEWYDQDPFKYIKTDAPSGRETSAA